MKVLLLSILSIIANYSFAQQGPIYGSSVAAPYVDANHLTRIINKQLNDENDSNCTTVKLIENSQEGLYLEHSKVYSANIAWANAWWFDNPGIWSVVGLGPVVDRNMLFFGSVDSKDNVKEFKSRNLPLKKENLDAWKVGDAVYWNSAGGAVLSLGAGYSIFQLGAQFVVQGSWGHYVEKTGPNKVFVSLTKGNIKNIQVLGGILYAGGSIGYLKNKFNSRSYEIELVDQAHIDAYRKFLRGSEIELKKLIENNSSYIEKIEDINANIRDRELALGIATPFFPILSYRIANNSSAEDLHGETSWGTVRDNYLGKYVFQKTGRAIHLDFNRSKTFLAGFEDRSQDADDSEEKVNSTSYFGKLEWHYESDHGRDKRLNNQLDRLYKYTDIDKLFCLNVSDFKDSLKYHQVLFKVELPEKFVKSLINKTSGNFFETLKPMLKKNEYKSLTDAISKIEKLDAKTARFSKAIAALGQKILSDKQISKIFINKMHECGAKISLEVSGQNISKVLKTIEADNTKECFN